MDSSKKDNKCLVVGKPDGFSIVSPDPVQAVAATGFMGYKHVGVQLRADLS